MLHRQSEQPSNRHKNLRKKEFSNIQNTFEYQKHPQQQATKHNWCEHLLDILTRFRFNSVAPGSMSIRKVSRRTERLGYTAQKSYHQVED